MLSNINFTDEDILFWASLSSQLPSETIKLLENANSVTWVGSGLSAIPAKIGSELFNRYSKLISTFSTVTEYLINEKKDTLPVLISYSGTNVDIQSVAKKIVIDGITNVILLTHKEENSTSKILKSNNINVHIICLPNHSSEAGFVTIKTTLGFIGLVMSLAYSYTKRKELSISSNEFEKIAKMAIQSAKVQIEKFNQVKNWSTIKIHLLGGGLNGGIQMLWQTLLAESSLCTITLGDVRDYLHAKYLSAFNEPEYLAILLDVDGVNKRTNSLIQKRFSPFFPVIRIESSYEHLNNYVYHLIYGINIIREILTIENLSFIKVRKPKDFNRWNNWGLNEFLIEEGKK